MAPAPDAATAAPPKPDIPLALSCSHVSATAVGDPVNVAVLVTEQPSEQLFVGTLAEPREENPFQSFWRTAHLLRMRWGPGTRIAMGTSSDIAPGALVRMRGVLGPDREVNAEGIAIITHVATIEEQRE
ncbi:MAG: hypothetical protein ACYDCQ_22030 [Dehalococcoidia bacterium]